MKQSKQSSQFLPNQKMGETFSLVSSVLSGSLCGASGGMMEKQASPQESEAERIFRRWDIGKSPICGDD